MTGDEQRVADLIRNAFRGVALGQGVGLLEGQGLDEGAEPVTLARYRTQDEKHDWTQIPVTRLNSCYTSLCFFDAAGMQFHLPAYLLAELERTYQQDIYFHLCHLYDYTKSQFAALNAAQRYAVREFLLWHFNQPDAAYDPLIENALATYWTASGEIDLTTADQ